MSQDSRDTPYGRIGRRELLATWGPAALVGAGLALAGRGLVGREGRHRPPESGVALAPPDWRVDSGSAGRLAVAGGRGPAENLRRALAAIGGIESFVRPGERVAIKPNVAWDRTPEQAADTDPTLVAELVRLCLAVGASQVTVLDNTCNDPGRSFERSGVGPAARAAGARVLHQGTAGTVELDLGGIALGRWQVLRPLVEADRVFNLPVVKHHSLGRATLGMKNWFGALVGRRGSLHQRLPQVCAELGAALRPTLTIVDATRVLTAGGPTGGSLDLVRADDLIAVATDPVAAEAWGAARLGLGPHELPHLEIAARLGLGTPDWASIATET